ncbi:MULTISPECIES: F0F1 ATP synthase subunit A [Tsukamurella]|uniref:ATP synthase subunit a n=2 Tax=Tsukamurella TaxID=2060 RepID=A0A5C5S2F4_9ACTN|nr:MULTISPECIES: F0F1 ATP synthase subunit A [Tsukamurella]NMD56395.1 F0F1 ATP synthase subunit A [Tsukamurella columbiensis]TWS29254.1 F0F1 ATP synthase subunit A [Tsukamurella conjunctivitidis]
MNTNLYAEGSIKVAHYKSFELFGMTFHWDTILATAIAAAIVLILAFILKAKVTSTGVPSGVQLFWEAITIQLRGQVESSIGMRVAPFLLPLAIALFTLILFANWLAVLPQQYTGEGGAPTEIFMPPAADVSFVYALVLVVYLGYHFAGFRTHGIFGYPAKVVKGHALGLAPINVIEELVSKPLSLALRLFGNVFAGTVMVAVIALLPAYVLWFPNSLWKSFELFVGLIQAFIFSLLTILYFSTSMEKTHH